MYPQQPEPTVLLPRQTRLINAGEGFRLEVLGGSLWLTRPCDAVDRFLATGSVMDLHEDLVLIQSDWSPATTPAQPALYRLVPLTQQMQQGTRPRASLIRRRGWLRLRPFSA
jgi:hypothetical protein